MGFEQMGNDTPESPAEAVKIYKFPEEESEGMIFLTTEQIKQLSDESIRERLEKLAKAIIELSNDGLNDKRDEQSFDLAVELKRRKGDDITIRNSLGEMKIKENGDIVFE